MYTKDGKTYYEWADYEEDMKAICGVININCVSDPKDYTKGPRTDTNILSIYRGSLGMGAHLSNVLELPLSVLQYQTRDNVGEKQSPKMVIDTIKNGSPIVVVDDICDSGKTMDDITVFLKENYPDSYLLRICLFGSPKNSSKSLYVREHDGTYIMFPWEYL
jgi:hypoxanthine phosphoribosyltransferase